VVRVRLFALTDLHSAKVRRVRRNPRVLIASCRADGKLRGELVPASVEVLIATRELERVRNLLSSRSWSTRPTAAARRKG
jgi:hypothetical protein